jgi:hypothetical protein
VKANKLIEYLQRAIAATGLVNRGDALAEICRSYLDEKRQLDFSFEV